MNFQSLGETILHWSHHFRSTLYKSSQTDSLRLIPAHPQPAEYRAQLSTFQLIHQNKWNTMRLRVCTKHLHAQLLLTSFCRLSRYHSFPTSQHASQLNQPKTVA